MQTLHNTGGLGGSQQRPQTNKCWQGTGQDLWIALMMQQSYFTKSKHTVLNCCPHPVPHPLVENLRHRRQMNLSCTETTFQECRVISTSYNSTNKNFAHTSVYSNSLYRSTENWKESKRGESMNQFQESKSLNKKKSIFRSLQFTIQKPTPALENCQKWEKLKNCQVNETQLPFTSLC